MVSRDRVLFHRSCTSSSFSSLRSIRTCNQHHRLKADFICLDPGEGISLSAICTAKPQLATTIFPLGILSLCELLLLIKGSTAKSLLFLRRAKLEGGGEEASQLFQLVFGGLLTTCILSLCQKKKNEKKELRNVCGYTTLCLKEHRRGEMIFKEPRIH